MNLTIGSTHFKLSLAVIGWIAALVFLVLFFRSNDPALETSLSSARQEVATVRKLVAGHAVYARQQTAARKKLADSLDALTHSATALSARAQQLAVTAQTVPEMQVALRSLGQSNLVCMDGLTLCRQRGDSLARADSVHSDSLARGLVRAGAATQQVITAAECHLVHIGPIKAFNCPSRIASARVGLVAGIVATLVTVAHFHVHF